MLYLGFGPQGPGYPTLAKLFLRRCTMWKRLAFSLISVVIFVRAAWFVGSSGIHTKEENEVGIFVQSSAGRRCVFVAKIPEPFRQGDSQIVFLFGINNARKKLELDRFTIPIEISAFR